MKKLLRNFIKSIIGQQFIPLCREYLSVPALIFHEIRRILSLIRYKRCYSNDPEVLLSKLRTRAHIVDKGLQILNWEKGHSHVPYVQLCRGIKTLQNSSFNTDPSYKWAIQKKDEYEHAQKFGAPDLPSNKSEHITITADDLLHLIRSRRSIRTFEERPIASETLKNLADIMSWSPTSCNRQPSKLFITQNKKKLLNVLNNAQVLPILVM